MRKILNNYTFLGVLLTVLMSLIGVVYAQTQNSGQEGFKAVKISKNRILTEAGQHKVSIKVTGMLNTDSVNIRPTNENEIDIKVLNTSEREVELPGGKKLRIPKDGVPIAEDALTFNENEIVFLRPQVEGKVLIDIALPEATELEVYFNNEQVIKSTALYSPIAVKDGKVKKGEITTAKAHKQVMFPELTGRNPNGIIKLGENKFNVPFSKLQLKKSDALANDGTSIHAIIEINEQGIVEKVSMIKPLNSLEVEQKIRQWEFVPYRKDGELVKVTTILIR